MACPRPHTAYAADAADATRGALRRASSRYGAVHYRQKRAARGSENEARSRVTNEGGGWFSWGNFSDSGIRTHKSLGPET